MGSVHVRGSLKSACAACARVFTVAPSKVDRGGGVTCSWKCRSSVNGYAVRILSALPGTVRQVAEVSHVSISCARDILGRMMRAGECHAVAFEPNPEGSVQGAPRFVPVLALGAPVDPDMPRDMRAVVTYHTNGLILNAMPARVPDIALAVDLPQTSVLRAVKVLHAAGNCHIGAWKRSDRGSPAAIYRAGPGVDVVCRLKNFTQHEKDRRHQRKMRTDPALSDAYDKRASQDRSRYWIDKAAKGDPLVLALFGARKPSNPPQTSENP